MHGDVALQRGMRLAGVAQRSLLQPCIPRRVQEQFDQGLVGIAEMAGGIVGAPILPSEIGEVVMRNDQCRDAVFRSPRRMLRQGLCVSRVPIGQGSRLAAEAHF